MKEWKDIIALVELKRDSWLNVVADDITGPDALKYYYDNLHDAYLLEAQELYSKQRIAKMDFMWKCQQEFQQSRERVMGTSKRVYFLTIRPCQDKITFDDFYERVNHYLTRKPIKSYHVAFEQKGMTNETLGSGFHCHAIINTPTLNKAQILLQCQSSFKDSTAANCIDVQPAPRPQEIIDEYLNYKSKDGHKEPMKEWDLAWRNQVNVKDYYTSEDPMPERVKPKRLRSRSPSSSYQVRKATRLEPTVLDWN